MQKPSRVLNVYPKLITDALLDGPQGRAVEWRESVVLAPDENGTLVSKTIQIPIRYERPILQIRLRTSRFVLAGKDGICFVPTHKNRPQQDFLQLLPVWAENGAESCHLKAVIDENGTALACEPA